MIDYMFICLHLYIIRMKMNKTGYFSLFFLCCFLGSFSTAAYQSIQGIHQKTTVQAHHKSTVVTCNEDCTANNDVFVLEEMEDETEEGFESQAIILPFLVSYIQFQYLHLNLFSAQSLEEQLTTPIYLSVCNFRI